MLPLPKFFFLFTFQLLDSSNFIHLKLNISFMFIAALSLKHSVSLLGFVLFSFHSEFSSEVSLGSTCVLLRYTCFF